MTKMHVRNITGLPAVLDKFDDFARQTVVRAMAEAGITVVAGSFEKGAVVTSSNEGVYQESIGKVYSWFTDATITVPAGTTPQNFGGVNATAWVDRTDDTFRVEILETVFQNMKRQAAEAGLNLVDGSFEEGANISGWPDVVWCQALGIYLQWYLDEAKTVAVGSTPTNIGTDWLDKSNITFKDNLADPDSTVLIAGIAANDLIALLQDTLSNIPVNTQTGTTYTLVLSDYTNGSIIEMDNAEANTVTIPSNSSVNFPVGAVIPIRQLGAGVTTIAADTGVTLRNPHATAKIAAQYGSATIHQRATDEWVLEGNIAGS